MRQILKREAKYGQRSTLVVFVLGARLNNSVNEKRGYKPNQEKCDDLLGHFAKGVKPSDEMLRELFSQQCRSCSLKWHYPANNLSMEGTNPLLRCTSSDCNKLVLHIMIIPTLSIGTKKSRFFGNQRAKLNHFPLSTKFCCISYYPTSYPALCKSESYF